MIGTITLQEGPIYNSDPSLQQQDYVVEKRYFPLSVSSTFQGGKWIVR